MANQQLLDYISQQKAAGSTMEELKKRLLDSGWPEADVSEATSEPAQPVIHVPQAVPTVDMSMPGKFDLGVKDQPLQNLPQLPQVAPGAAVESKGAVSGLVWAGLAILILVAVGAVGYGWWQKSNQKAIPAQVNTQLSSPIPEAATPESKISGMIQGGKYFDTNLKFAVSGPENWKTDTSGAFGTLVVFSNPQPDTEGGNQFVANMNVVAEEIGNKNLTEYIQSSKELLKSSFTNHALLSEQDIHLGTAPAVVLESTFDQGVFKLHNVQLITLAGTKAFIVTGTSLDSAWEQYKQVFGEALLSFELK